MGLEQRRAHERDEFRNKILAGAEYLFIKYGYENVSMRKIAREIEYSPGTIYLYFKNKSDLLYQLLDKYHIRLLEIEDSIYLSESDSIAGLRISMRAYVDFGLAHPQYYRLCFIIPPLYPAEGQLHEGDIGTKLYLNLCSFVERCIERGTIRKGDLNRTAQTIWATVHGITSLLVTNPNFPWSDKDKFIDQSIETTIEGLR